MFFFSNATPNLFPIVNLNIYDTSIQLEEIEKCVTNTKRTDEESMLIYFFIVKKKKILLQEEVLTKEILSFYFKIIIFIL